MSLAIDDLIAQLQAQVAQLQEECAQQRTRAEGAEQEVRELRAQLAEAQKTSQLNARVAFQAQEAAKDLVRQLDERLAEQCRIAGETPNSILAQLAMQPAPPGPHEFRVLTPLPQLGHGAAICDRELHDDRAEARP